MSGIGSTIGQAISGAPQSIASGEGIFGSLAHAINPTVGGIYDDLTKVAGLALTSGLSGSGPAVGGGGLLGGGASSGGSDATAGAMQPAGTLAGMPYYSADQYANYGPNAPGSAALGYSASFAPPVAPPPAPASGVGGASPTGGNLPAGGPAGTAGAVPPPPLGGVTGGGPGQYYFNGQSWVQNPANNTPAWYEDPGYWQGAGSVGSAYLKYLSDNKQPEFAKPFGSTVTPQTLNPLAGVRSSPIQPPTLTV